ncbi:MAG: NAD(P)/FAD-dependent oxidoreductase [Candidatus Melainabacteria bacterium]|nr:NAD(P)/FAD-dependent oxidoreductase [Candidatus Melainabacteria bacterium]
MTTPTFPCDLVVVGGGAAGFFAAIQAKTVRPQLSVVLLEAAPKPLGKVRISGGGRCNVTHACFDPEALTHYYPRGFRELRSVFQRFSPADTCLWFESRGVPLKTEPDGRIFPQSDQSESIIQCLLQEAERRQIRLFVQHPVQQVNALASGGFEVHCPNRVFTSHSVVLATGGKAPPLSWLQQMGHPIEAQVPSLFTFEIADPAVRQLSGLSVPNVTARLEVSGRKPIEQAGPLLFTHWGLSGPVILKLSAWGARILHENQYRANLKVDFTPDHTENHLLEKLLQNKEAHPKQQIGNTPLFSLPKRLWALHLQAAHISLATPCNALSRQKLLSLCSQLKKASFQISGKGVFKEEFVSAGGVCLKEVAFKTMESRQVPGLFLAGEILDIDGLTGGFNFQNAWSTGFIAGHSAAEYCLKRATSPTRSTHGEAT